MDFSLLVRNRQDIFKSSKIHSFLQQLGQKVYITNKEMCPQIRDSVLHQLWFNIVAGTLSITSLAKHGHEGQSTSGRSLLQTWPKISVARDGIQ